MSEVIVVIGAGSIGQAIARRVSAGKHVVLADLRLENADAAAEVMRNAGFEVSTATVDVLSRDSVHALVKTATSHGDITGVIHAAGVPPVRHRRQRSSRSTSTAPLSCSRSSGMSSHAAAPASSLPPSPDTVSQSSTAEQNTAPCDHPGRRLAGRFRCSNPTRSQIHFTPTSSPNAATHCA